MQKKQQTPHILLLSAQYDSKYTVLIAEGITQEKVINFSGLRRLLLPKQMEQRGEKQLVVDGNAHVARFVEG